MIIKYHKQDGITIIIIIVIIIIMIVIINTVSGCKR